MKFNAIEVTPAIRMSWLASIWKITLGLLVMAALISSLVPPFQSPDEGAHLKRAYLLSKGRVLLETPSGQSSGGYIDQGLLQYMNLNLALAGHSEKKVNADLLAKTWAIQWVGTEQFSESPGVGYYFPLIYLPQALGLGAGRLLRLNLDNSYYLARTLACLASLLLLAAAFKSYRPSYLSLGLLLMPMMIFQWIATSQDAIAVALCVFVCCQFIRLMQMPDGRALIPTAWLLSACILILINARTNLLPMLLLPFTLALKFPHKRSLWINAALLLLLTCIWTLIAMKTTVDLRVSIGKKPIENLTYYLLHPWEYLRILFATLGDSRSLRFYHNSFIGILGWLDTPLKKSWLLLVDIGLLISLVASISRQLIKTQKSAALSLILVAIASLLLTFFLLLITWTPQPAEQIQGVQGRYFWCPLLVLCFALTRPIAELELPRQKVGWLGVGLVALCSFVYMPRILLERYYIAESQVAAVVRQFSQKNYVAKAYTLKQLKPSGKVAAGGFIDKLKIEHHQLILVGWGFFSGDEKQFFSNQPDIMAVSVKTHVRSDVVSATGDEQLILAGFELTFNFVDDNELQTYVNNLCLYSQDKKYGTKLLNHGASLGLGACKER